MRGCPTACGTCDLTNPDTIHSNPDTIWDKFGSDEEEKAGIIIPNVSDAFERCEKCLCPFRDVNSLLSSVWI